jgi:hypothetical protein
VIQVPFTPAVVAALGELQGVQRELSREAERIAEPADAERGAQEQGGDLDAETFLDATLLAPATYRANARTVAADAERTGTLLDVYA